MTELWDRRAAGTQTQAPPLVKKRKLPATFYGPLPPSEETKIEAAKRLQRFLRWRRMLAAQVDPILQEPIAPKDAVRLLEANGVENWFSAASLAAYFIATARFWSPLSRRPLWCWEVVRVMRLQPRRLQPLVGATYIARFALLKDAYENEDRDSTSTAEEDLDASFQSMLARAEACFFECHLECFMDDLDDYEDALHNLARLSLQRATAVCRRHREAVSNLGVICPPQLGAAIRGIQDGVVLKKSPPQGNASLPSSILKSYLLKRLDFQ